MPQWLRTAAAPQFLVDRLDDALAFYEQRLGFERDFVYEDFYASVSRDGAVIHLKMRSEASGEEHLDAHLAVSGVRELHDEFVRRGAPIVKPLEQRPSGQRDFYVEDPDGYILCFSEPSNTPLKLPAAGFSHAGGRARCGAW